MFNFNEIEFYIVVVVSI